VRVCVCVRERELECVYVRVFVHVTTGFESCVCCLCTLYIVSNFVCVCVYSRACVRVCMRESM